MLYQQKAENGNGKLAMGLEAHFGNIVKGTPEDFDDWLYLTQLNQARAVQLGVEWFRSLAPRCMSTLYWQLNDCWPVTSWAAVDGYGYKKPLWYATRRFFADQLLTFRPREDGLRLFYANDSDSVATGEILVQRLHFDGTVKAEETVSYRLNPRQTSALAVHRDLLRTDFPEREFLVARTGEQKQPGFLEPTKTSSTPNLNLQEGLRATA